VIGRLRVIASAALGPVRSITRSVASDRPVAWWAIACASLAPVLFMSAWLFAGLLQPPSYSPMRNTISGLASHAATDRWIVTSAFFIVGLCYLIMATGLSVLRAVARIDLAVAGGAAVGVAVCPQPANGTTLQHLVFAAIGSAAIAIFPLLTARRDAVCRVISLPVAIAVTALFLAMLGWLVAEAQSAGSGLGLAERLDSSVQICWPPILAVALYRAERQRQRVAGRALRPWVAAE
jgi:hypothetical membrane protein